MDKSLRPVLRPSSVEEKRKAMKKSEAMNKRLNASGATALKGSLRGSQLSAEKMSEDPARGGTDPERKKGKSALKALSFQNGGDVEAPNAGIKALRKQADGGNKNAEKALQNIGYKNGGCVMTKTNQSPKLY